MAAVTAVVRRFVTVGNRQVHYRRGGSGPPAVLLHESPLSSRVLVPLAEALAGVGFTAFALDTPGYGQSDPLHAAAPTVADYAAATAEAIEALGIGQCLLYGAHTGAQIAIELARTRPDLVTGLVAEGPPLLTAAERDELLARYCPPLDPVWDGSHLLAAWAMRRDQAIFWPWFSHDRSHRRSADMLPAEVLHDGLVDTLRAGAGYGLGYRAAYTYDCGPALAALAVPAHVVVTEGIFLADQLERLPALPATVQVELLPDDRAVAVERLCAIAGEHRPAAAAPPPPPSLHIAGRITRDYATTAFGQLLARRATETAGRPLVLLHASPGSAASLEPLLLLLAPYRPVVALDTLGHGESDAPTWQEAPVDDSAMTVIAALDRLGVADFDLFGTHTGAEIAIRVAALASHRVHSLVLSNVNLAGPELRASLLERQALPVLPRDDGSHLLEAWGRLKDSAGWFPWYERTRTAIRWQAPPSAAELHALLVELLKGGATNHIATNAGFAHDTAAALRQVQARTLVVSALGDVLHEHSGAAAELLANGTAYLLPGPVAETAAVIERFLRSGAPG